MSDKLNTISMRELKRGTIVTLADKLPAKLTYDGEVVAVILPIHVYNRLVSEYRQGDKPIYTKEKAMKFDAMERR